MLGEPKNQFSLTRAALSTGGRAKSKFLSVCPAECSYCFGPHRGPIMSPETMDAALDFMGRIVGETGQGVVNVTFHGGEP
jgi:sulfatase maturation enzyme AslB (radical SAM superfamily)